MTSTILETRGLSKSFGAVTAAADININIDLYIISSSHFGDKSVYLVADTPNSSSKNDIIFGKVPVFCTTTCIFTTVHDFIDSQNYQTIIDAKHKHICFNYRCLS